MPTSRHHIPTIASLNAFATAAKYGNFTIAAQKLNTSQSAISRYITMLEQQLNTALFTRKHNRVYLTQKGAFFYQNIQQQLDNLAELIAILREETQQPYSLTIACSHDISHLYMIPRLKMLQQNLGNDVEIHINTMEYEQMPHHGHESDIELVYCQNNHIDESHHLILPERITPVCTKEFYQQHRKIMDNLSSDWFDLPLFFLDKNSNHTNNKHTRITQWTSWSDYFSHYHIKINDKKSMKQTRNFNNYAYLLEAVCLGKGIGLGWQGLIERHVQQNLLITPIAQTATMQGNHGLYARILSHQTNSKSSLITNALDSLTSA